MLRQSRANRLCFRLVGKIREFAQPMLGLFAGDVFGLSDVGQGRFPAPALALYFFQIIQTAAHRTTTAATGLLNTMIVRDDGQLPWRRLLLNQVFDNFVSLAIESIADVNTVIIFFGDGAWRRSGSVEDYCEASCVVAVSAAQPAQQGQARFLQTVRADLAMQQAHCVQQIVAVDEVTHGAVICSIGISPAGAFLVGCLYCMNKGEATRQPRRSLTSSLFFILFTCTLSTRPSQTAKHSGLALTLARLKCYTPVDEDAQA